MAFLFTREFTDKDCQEELQCPICLDDYNDPKLLPCRHSLCAGCIQDLASSSNENQSINCPLCRAICRIPKGGAKKLPSNTKLERLLKEAPAARAKEEIMVVINQCTDSLASLRDITKRANRALDQEGQKIKRRITEVYENIAAMIRQQKKQLYKEVDGLISSQKSNHPAALLINKTEKLIQDINDVLKQNESRSVIRDKDVFIQHLTEAKIAASKFGRNSLEVRKKTSLEFHRNLSMMQCLSSSLFGSVAYRNTSQTPALCHKGLASGLDIIKPGSRFRSLQVPTSIEAKFQPYAIAGNSKGKVAVSCHGTHSVLVYKENGEFCQSIGRRGSGNGELECPTGVTFLNPHIVAIADGCLFGNPSRLQAFDSTGRFVRRLTQLTKNTHWLTYITAQENQKIIITCSHVAMEYESYVQILDTDGTVTMAFGATGPEKLLSPVKTIQLNNEYFVSDLDKSSNCCMIKVFDAKGRYVRSFGDCMLKRDIKDNPSYPLVITGDPWRGLILAYSGLFKVIRCYKPDGSLVSYHGTVSGITDMVLTIDRRLFVVCDGSGEFPHSVQILFHT